MEVSKEQYIKWRSDETTKEYLKRLFEKRELLKEGLAEGQAGLEQERTIGQCQAYKDAIDYGLYDFEFIDVEEKKID